MIARHGGSRLNTIANLFIIGVVVYTLFITFVLFTNFRYVSFAVRRHDIVEAGMKVDQEEQQIIEQKIKEIRTQSVKKILTPVVAEQK